MFLSHDFFSVLKRKEKEGNSQILVFDNIYEYTYNAVNKIEVTQKDLAQNSLLGEDLQGIPLQTFFDISNQSNSPRTCFEYF